LTKTIFFKIVHSNFYHIERLLSKSVDYLFYIFFSAAIREELLRIFHILHIPVGILTEKQRFTLILKYHLST